MLFYNEDWMHFIWTRYNAGIEITEDKLKEYIYSFRGTQITDFTMNVNGTVSTADSKVFETFADRYLVTEDNGYKVDYRNTCAYNVYDLIVNRKIDMYRVWIDALNEIGINPWISIRMNDCHRNMEETHLWRSKYVLEHPEYHIAAHRERTSYFDRCFDYAHKEIRDRMIAYIDEILGRYDVYGIELDMMRDTFFFEYGMEDAGYPIMTEFMGEVVKVIEKYETKYAHEIKLKLILPPSPNLVIERGIDIFGFIDNVDFITIIPRWETIDTDMPIELWKQLLRGTGCKLGCGHQLLFKPYRGYKPVISTVKMAFGQAIANLSRGSDYVYLYNYMDMAEYEGEIADWVFDESVRNNDLRTLMFNNIGSMETLLRQERSHVVTYCDFGMYDIGAYCKLPVEFGKNKEYERIKIPVGKLPEEATICLILGIKERDTIDYRDISVYVNARECTFNRITRINKNVYEDNCYIFDVQRAELDIMYAEIKIEKKCMLEYVEIEVIPE